MMLIYHRWFHSIGVNFSFSDNWKSPSAENSHVTGVALPQSPSPSCHLIPCWQDLHWGCRSGAGAGSSGHPHQQSSGGDSSQLPMNHPSPDKPHQSGEGVRKGGREEVTEIISWGTKQHSCCLLPYLTITNPVLAWLLSKKKPSSVSACCWATLMECS